MIFPTKYNIFEKHENLFGASNKDGGIKFFVPPILYKDDLNFMEQMKLLHKYQNLLIGYAKKRSIIYPHLINFKDSWQMLNGCIELLNDYFTNDKFLLIDHFYNKGNNKINWNRTLNKGNILVSEGQIIYEEFISSNRKKNGNNDFLKLYNATLNFAKSIIIPEITYKYENIPFSDNQRIYIINKFIDESYRDRDIYIAKILKQIYENGGLEKSLNNMFKNPFHEKFENIWEYLIEQIIPKNINIIDDYKEKSMFGTYMRFSDNTITNGVSYKLDHLIRKENKILILDSKFYNSYYENKFPKTADISKQEHYKTIIKEKFKIDDIKSYFIFPKSEINAEPEFFAIHEVENSNNFKIYCFAFDINKIIDMESNKLKYNDLFEIFQIN